MELPIKKYAKNFWSQHCQLKIVIKNFWFTFDKNFGPIFYWIANKKM
jgi:hypothetical protein